MAKPMNDAQWAREVERRLQALEQPQVVRVGAWSLSEDRSGRLIGENARSGKRIVLDP